MVLKPFITIMTASLNSGATIGRTLASVAEQSFDNLEHLVMDGGSTDQTVGILKEFEKRYRLEWLSETDSGIANALNKGLRLAKGRYLLVLQADDCLAGPEVLETVHLLLERELVDIHSFPVLREESPKNTFFRPFRILWWYHFKTVFPHPGTFVHRRVYERVGDFREELALAMDYDFFYRALKAGSTVKLHQYPVAMMGGQGISSNRDFLSARLQEEATIQALNETNPLWRGLQSLFRSLYVPYKLRLLPHWESHFNKSNPE